MSDKVVVTVKAFYKEVMPTYLDNLKLDVPSLKEKVDGQDFSALSAYGHKLSGTAGSFGFTFLYELGEKLEEAADSKKLDSVRDCIERFEEFLVNLEIVYEG